MINRKTTAKLASILIFGWITLLAGTSIASADDIATGKKVAFDRKKGNCLACHAIAGGSLPGNIGPPLVAMKARFPNKADLRAQIWDSTVANPNTIMPPFGKHRILTEKEVDLVTEFIYTL
jgi:sulfur-oxidizing protein SoxX